MAGLKEIRIRLQSVKNTKKITYAMKLVSAAKLRKAQESVARSREYTNALNSLLREVVAASESEQTHPLLRTKEEPKKIRVLVLGGSRGLCGGYNSNVNKQIEAFIRARQNGPVSIDWVLVGKKPAEYFRRLNRPYVKSFENLTEDANNWDIESITRAVEHDFLTEAIDEVYMIFTRFKSAISMQPTCEKLLPLESDLLQNKPLSLSKVIFEPSPAAVFSAMLPRVLRAKVRQAALDAKASEQGSRMTAMDSATKNAGELIHKLELTLNKLRQTSITSQLLDIIGGAEAVQ
ncbi:MAG: ATP synthase F1 subunit gamma [Oligoflexia bacterium]|nr:ATP synthase F1 subunit gamma [Oligoflexia bacterium]